MGWFSSKSPVSTDEKAISDILTRGVAEVIVKEDLRKKLLSGKQLRIKLGIDPTSPDLHIGRAVSLLKLRDFQELGHQIVFIVGDFTAVIGDTSDKDAERPMLSHDAIKKNEQTYREQVGNLIDLSRAEFRYNSEWLGRLTYREIGEHADFFSVSDFVARENIARRIEAGKRVSLREVLYPLMQGYDSVAVNADVELGGTDQKFNLLAGRTLQEKYGQQAQNVVMNPLIEGLDGRKMSSSWGNTIPLTASPADMYGKVMSMGDSQVRTYFELCTRVPMQEINEIVGPSNFLHPKEQKMRLAFEIVSLYHGKDAAQKAADGFMKPDEAPEFNFSQGEKVRDFAGRLNISMSELRRLVSAGAIEEVSGEKMTSIDTPLIATTYKIGKHRFIKVVIK